MAPLRKSLEGRVQNTLELCALSRHKLTGLPIYLRATTQVGPLRGLPHRPWGKGILDSGKDCSIRLSLRLKERRITY